jgi:YVTN family beta-propeller protein
MAAIVFAFMGPIVPALAGPIALPLPIYLETFDAVAEGGLPAGWSRTNYSTLPAANFNLQDLDSAYYAGWLVVDRSRFTSNFLSYSSHTPQDYSRVLSSNPANVVNGQGVPNLAQGRFMFCTSGWREGSQLQYLWSPDFNLSGQTNVYVSYHSLFEQNQDSLGAVEYSVNGGATWLPIVYMLDGPDVLTAGDGSVDAVKTFTNRYADVATNFIGGVSYGGYYGAFIGATLSPSLATNISARVDDNPVESKRVELFRLTAADNQPAVRFRFAHAGADSWYFGIDDFGLYSITPGALPVISNAPPGLNLSEGSAASFTVVAGGPPPLSYQWRLNGTNIAGATNASFAISAVASRDQGVYTVVVSNGSGALESGGATLTVYVPVVTGQWDFNLGDLRATVGADLEFLTDTATLTTFPVMMINGQPAQVLGFGSNSLNQGYYVRHGVKPNGGGQFVNQYTLLLDVLYPAASSDQWRALLQTDPFNHAGNEADFLVGNGSGLPDANGVGAEAQFNGSLAADTWYRVALAVDLTAPAGQQLKKYVNGVNVGSQSLSGGVDGRYALGPTALLFTAGLGAGGFTRPGFVNSLQFVNGWLSPAALAALGGPTAEGLPPGNAALRITNLTAGATSVTLNWTAPDGACFVERTTNLFSPNWQAVNSAVTNRNLSVPISHTAAFYRVGQSTPDIRVGQLPDGEQSIPSKQILRAAGKQLQFSGRPVDLVLSPDGKIIYIKNINNLLVVEAATWTLLQTASYIGSGASLHGIAMRHSGSHVYVTGAANELNEWAVATNGTVTFSRTIAMPAGSFPCGLAISADDSKAYVCLSIANKLAVVNLTSGAVTQQIAVGIAPWDVVLSPDGNTAYVSDWGGRFPTGGDLTAPSAGTEVVIDSRGVAASGVVSFVNLLTGLQTAQTATGLHPCDLELSADGQTLYVANANSDTVSVINTVTGAVKETILVRPDPTFPYGSASTGLALSKDGSSLFVTSGGNNAVALVELPNAQHTNSLVQGFLPTDWYPGAVVVDSNHLYVANVKGLGSRDGQPITTSWQIGAHLGTANKIPIPAAEPLSKYTAQAFEDGRVPHIKQTQQSPLAGQPPVPVPRRTGEPSVFQHVVYILKENKTYDQMFGDLPQGNGDSNLCIYPRLVSPNHHALAEQYVLLDNFYCNGVNSSDGHSWSTEANNTDHLEKAFGGFSRSYTFGDDPLTYSSSGFIWNNVLQHGLTFRNYGEMDYASTSPSKTWLQIYQDYTNNTDAIRYVQNIGIASLRPYSSTNVPGWNMDIPDVVRARGFIKELNAAQSNGVWASFHLLYLPNDHTGGTPSPRAQVADNDLSLGQAVEAITKSIFATNTVIFVIEDDPQSGYDHVDGHRSICLVISPYTKRGQVISTFYNQPGVLHTMERILGLPPMNQQDAMAPLMFGCFTNVPNFTPYTALPNNISLTENVVAIKMSPKQRYYAKKVQKMDFSKPDRINDDVFNRYIWYSIKGDVRYPAEFVGGHGKGLKQLGLVLVKNAKDDDD